MSRSIGLAHIIRHDDGTSSGVWGIYTLQSAFQPIFAFNEGTLSVAAFEGLIRPFRDGEPQSPVSFFGTCPAADRLHIEAQEFGGGVAVDLLHAVLAAHAGIPSIALEVIEGNDRAIAFYRKHGFEVVERRPAAHGVGGHASLIMRRMLPRA